MHGFFMECLENDLLSSIVPFALVFCHTISCARCSPIMPIFLPLVLQRGGFYSLLERMRHGRMDTEPFFATDLLESYSPFWAPWSVLRVRLSFS